MVNSDYLRPSVEAVLDVQISESLKRFHRPAHRLFISALAAGLEIGFSLLLMVALYTHLVGNVSAETLFLLVALGYPIGFILIVVGDSDLFTEHTALATYPVLSGQESITRLLQTWGIILAGNLLGGYLFSTMLYFLLPQLSTVSVEGVVAIAEKLLAVSSSAMLISAILAGWLMGLVSWLVASAKETISAIAVVTLVTLTIGIIGLHHSIVGSIEVFSALLFTTEITLQDYLQFQLVTLLGNAIGGVFFVAGLKYSQRDPNAPEEV